VAETNIGIRSFGAYIPRRRMSRAAIAEAHAWAFPALKGQAKGERSFCGWDEDVITQAVEAGRDCLVDAPSGMIESLQLASTTAPYADLQNAALVNAALGLAESARCSDAGGSTQAGLSALVQACIPSATQAGRMVIAAERRMGKPASAKEMRFGCGAAAVLLGQGDDLIARFLGAESVSIPFVDHFRQSDQKHDYGWEERWVRDEGVSKIVPDAIKRLLKRLGRSADAVAHFGFAGGPAGSAAMLAKRSGLSGDALLSDLHAEVGDTGAAHPLLMLISALERAEPGDLIVVASFAQGCEIAAFEMMRKPAQSPAKRGLAGSIAQRIPEAAYLKMLSFQEDIQLDWGMRAETDKKTALTEMYRSSSQVFGFLGGQCEHCGTVQFPRLPSCINCLAVDSQKPFALADQPAQVATYTADWLMYTPSPPLYVGLVQFDVGARVLMEMVDVGPDGIEVGTPLKMAFRIKERDRLRHFDRYFWKATPFA
jgi:3-hydroxy-3-methylglutaryl CoA synthase